MVLSLEFVLFFVECLGVAEASKKINLDFCLSCCFISSNLLFVYEGYVLAMLPTGRPGPNKGLVCRG